MPSILSWLPQIRPIVAIFGYTWHHFSWLRTQGHRAHQNFSKVECNQHLGCQPNYNLSITALNVMKYLILVKMGSS